MAFRLANHLPVLETAGKTTNPTTTSVLADTGALASAIYEVSVFVGCSAAATFVIQRRNAANDASVGDVPVIRAAAGQTAEYMLTYALNTNERIRVLPEANITGDAEATIIAVRVA
jgi:hypothetical protein